MKNVKIIGTGSYVPDHVVTNDDLATFLDTSDEWISTRTGIKERRISNGEDTPELSTNAAKNALKAAGIDSSELDLIIVATVSPKEYFPSTACRVQDAIGADNAMAFDISAACSGFVFALDMATQYIKVGSAKTALIIGTEVLSKLADWEDRSSCVLFGDGAGAAVITETEEEGIGKFFAKSVGSKGDVLTCTARDLVNHYVEKISPDEDKYISMNGQEVYKFVCSVVPDCIKNVIEGSNYKVEDVDHFVLHQANSRIINAVAKRLKVDESKFFVNIHKYGNTSAASIPIALDEMFKADLLKKGDKIVISGFGGGLTYGAAFITI